MNKFIVTISMAFLLCVNVNGQNVSGIVKDRHGKPINGAKVSLAEQENISCVTDEKGFYSLPVEEGTYLNVGYTNSAMKLVKVMGREMNIVLDASKDRVIDLGFVKKTLGNLTQAVSTVSSEVLERNTATIANNALYGLLPGLYAKQNVGWHSIATLNVRGKGNLGSAAPLVIVDGFPRSMTTLALEEIESVSVLKDGAATALWGARGANGVILVNTKRGAYNSFDVDVNYKHGFTLPVNRPEMADAYTYARAMNEALVYDGLAPKYSASDLETFRSNTGNPNLYPNVDWVKEGTRQMGENNQLNMLVRGGGQKLRYMSMLDYKNDFGLLNSDYTEYSDRYKSQIRNYDLSLRMNMDVDMTSSTLLQFGIVGMLNEAKRPNTAINEVFSNLYKVPSAAFPVKTTTGKWGGNLLYGMNPIAEIADEGYYQTNSRSLEANMRIKQDLSMLLKGLTAEAAIAYDNSATFLENGTKSYQYEVYTYSDETGTESTTYGDNSALKVINGSSNSVLEQYIRSNWEVKLGYDRSWQDHQLNIGAFYRQEMEEILGVNVARYRHSILGTASYNYQNKYMVDVVANTYGTSVLLEGDKFRFYPAVSAAWVLSNEAFLKNQSFIDLLKIRASYGRSAQDNLSYGLGKHYWSNQREYYFGDSNTELVGMMERKLPMRTLELETADKYNIGIDARFFKNLTFTADVYYDKRSNMLVSNKKTSGMLGIEVPQQTIGKVESRGLELSLGWDDQWRSFRYYANANISFYDSKVLENGEEYQPYDYLYNKGHKVGQFFGLEAIGYFRDQEDIRKSPEQTFSAVRPGDVKYKDQNGDERIDDFDRVALGKSTEVPETVYGLNLGFSYKGFGVDMTFQGVSGISKVLDLAHIHQPLRNNNNISMWYLKDRVRWTESTKDIANAPRLSTLDNANNYRGSSQWLENGSFFKLRNLNVYYTFPEKWASKMKMDKCQLYVRAQDLFSLDHIKDLNSESLSLDYFDTMAISLGLNVNF